MPIARANDIDICYDTFGDAADPAVLLIRGLGGQMIAWREPFCEALAARGLHVVRFDNRDVGLSSKLESVTYTLDDMAADAVGLLDHLGIPAAHVVGMSMGGMIAQVIAIAHPDRALSLTSIMSHMGGPDAVPPTPEAVSIFSTPAATTRGQAVENAVQARRVIGNPGFPFDEEEVREMAARAYDRCDCPEGRIRQVAAIRSAPSRREALGRLRIPVLVIHGVADPLVPVENGCRTAAAVQGSELLEIDGMGHDLPPGAWSRIIDAITAVAARATAPAGR